MASDLRPTWPLARTLAWFVLGVMALTVVYTGWIAVANFDHIGV